MTAGAEINMFSVFAETLQQSMMKQTVISSGRLFRSFGPAEANDPSPNLLWEDATLVV